MKLRWRDLVVFVSFGEEPGDRKGPKLEDWER